MLAACNTLALKQLKISETSPAEVPPYRYKPLSWETPEFYLSSKASCLAPPRRAKRQRPQKPVPLLAWETVCGDAADARETAPPALCLKQCSSAAATIGTPRRPPLPPCT